VNCPDCLTYDARLSPPDAAVPLRRAERVLGVTHGFMGERPAVLTVAAEDGLAVYIVRWGGTDTVLGCTCHHEVIDYRDGQNIWRVMVFDIEPVIP